ARIAETLGDDAGAVTDWREILVHRPRDRAAMNALKRLHAAREEWAEAAEIAEREITVVSELTSRQAPERKFEAAAPPPGFTGAFELPDVSGEPAPDPQTDSSTEGFATLLPDLGELHLAL